MIEGDLGVQGIRQLFREIQLMAVNSGAEILEVTGTVANEGWYAVLPKLEGFDKMLKGSVETFIFNLTP